jgi:hypothetical protein
MLWLTLFSIAMGFLETAVVIYLRKIYYPHGFQFPLTPVDPYIGLVEFLREAATIIMLVGIGILTGKNASQKFAIFIYSFAIWDIFYYVFLKLLLGWPDSLLDWDILFLIPVPWVGPVLAPCLVSLTMIALTAAVIYFQEKGYHAHINFLEWILLISGSLVIMFSFMQDYFKYLYHGGVSAHVWTLGCKQDMFNEIASYVPSSYSWWLFCLGEAIILAGIFLFIQRIIKLKQHDIA